MVARTPEPKGLEAAERALAQFAASLRPGLRCVLQSLQRRPELNGAAVEVLSWDPQAARWKCQMKTGEVMNVPTNNLAPAPGESPEASGAAPTTRTPWRIDVPRKAEPPRRRGSAGGRPAATVAAAGGEPRWRCTLVQQLAADRSRPMSRIVGRWAERAEDFATGHVREAFDGLWQQLTDGSAPGEVRVALALAGADVADHEATMRQAEELVRASQPGACVARVGPDDFRSLSLAVRRICFQLTRGGPAGAEVYPEEEEDEDAEQSRQGICAGGASDFVDWRRERGLAGPVVLLVSQADAVPKDTLRDVLSCWGAACGDSDIPMLVMLGLQQPPPSRSELLEREPLTALDNAGTGCLFDALTVCNQLLEHIVSDPECPVALTPQLFQRLRDIFLYTRHSVSYVIKTLALLCERFLSSNGLARVLCPPLDDPLDASGLRPVRLSRVHLEGLFRERLVCAPELADRLRELRQPEDRLCSNDQLLTWASQAAAQVVLWRRSIIDSFGAWDELLCALHPMARHEVRLRRLIRLLQALWPQADAPSAGGADSVEAEKRAMSGLLNSLLKLLDPSQIRREHVEKLLDNLLSICLPQDANLQAGLEALKAQASSDKELCKGLQEWFHQLHKACWQSLEGPARQLFLQGFFCGGHLAKKVEQQLSGTGSLCSEAILLPLAKGCGSDATPFPDDAALLFRLLESGSGRAVAVVDLWECFQKHARQVPDGNDALMKRRFGQALHALHMMGLFAPRQGTRQHADGSPPVSGWKLLKRRYGRIAPSLAQAAKAQQAALRSEAQSLMATSAAATAPAEAPASGGADAAGSGGAPAPGTPQGQQRALRPFPPGRALLREISDPKTPFTGIKRQAPLQPQATPWRGDPAPAKEVRTPGSAKRARVFMG